MKIIDKIEKLLALSMDSAATENEARVALAKARELMILHKINESDITREKEEFDIVAYSFMDIDSEVWLYNLLSVFTSNFPVKHFFTNEVINSEQILRPHIMGEKVDVEAVKILYTCAKEYISKCENEFVKQYGELFYDTVSDTLVNTYRAGFIFGVKDKYEKQNKMMSMNKLMVIPSDKVLKAFEDIENNSTTEEHDFSMPTNDDLIKQHGYNDGLTFGSTEITD